MFDIDFVITWVDGNDPAWQAEKEKYRPTAQMDNNKLRYRDWDNLQYWFRAVEKYAPWVRKIYFVTWGHVPSWLDTTNEKLVIVNHKDYIPEKYLPTFSSRAIDMNFHLIKDLAEHFVYFNDDMYLTAPVKPEDFFRKGLPCDTAVLNATIFEANYVTDIPFTAPAFGMIPVNRHFKMRQSIKKNWIKWFNPRYGLAWLRTLLLMPWSKFPGFMNYHLPYAYLKSTYETVWQEEEKVLDETCSHRFRAMTDVNHWVFNYWQIASGKFAPRSPKVGKLTALTNDDANNKKIYGAIKNGTYKMLCINDAVTADTFEKIRDDLKACFDQVFPEKSIFEK